LRAEKSECLIYLSKKPFITLISIYVIYVSQALNSGFFTAISLPQRQEWGFLALTKRASGGVAGLKALPGFSGFMLGRCTHEVVRSHSLLFGCRLDRGPVFDGLHAISVFVKGKFNMLNATKSIAACALAICATGVFSQNMPNEALKNVAQLSASGSIEVQQDLLSISMTTSRDGQDAAAVQTQLRQALDAALTQARPDGRAHRQFQPVPALRQGR
jgi:hypothetical protein